MCAAIFTCSQSSYWPAYWASIVLLAGVCRRLYRCVKGGPAGRRARERSGSRHCTAGKYGYVPLGRHLVSYYLLTVVIRRMIFVEMLLIRHLIVDLSERLCNER